MGDSTGSDRDDDQPDPALDLVASIAELANGDGEDVRDFLDGATGDATVTEAMSFGIGAATSIVEQRRALRGAAAAQGEGPAIRVMDVRDEDGRLVAQRVVASDPQAAVGITDDDALVVGEGYQEPVGLEHRPVDVKQLDDVEGVTEAIVDVDVADDRPRTEQLLDSDVDVDDGGSSSIGPGSAVDGDGVRTGEPDATLEDVPEDLATLIDEADVDVDADGLREAADRVESGDAEGGRPEDS